MLEASDGCSLERRNQIARLLEILLPESMANAADRTTFDKNRGSLLNPINLGVAVLNLFDRPNKLNEPPGRSTVNLALKGRKPE